MTHIEKLQNQVENLRSQILNIDKERYEIEKEMLTKINDYILECFSKDIDKDIIVKTNSWGVSFKIFDKSASYLKDIFEINFKENYSFKRNEPKYEDIYLNYYTTYADNEFEYKRLENLGKVASIMREMKDQILLSINSICEFYNNKIWEEKYSQRVNELETQIKEINSEIKSIQIEENKNKLFNEGLMFKSGLHIRLKGNFEPKLNYLKLINVSKSGKKADAEYSYFNGGNTFIEEGVNVERIISQIINVS